MADKMWNHRLHGDDLHDLAIFLVERHVIKKGGVLKPTRDFRGKKICPCEPDVYFSMDTKLIEGNKRVHQKGLYVVEIETKATNESRMTKYKQYKESLAGLTDLIVIDLEKEFGDWLLKREEKIGRNLAITGDFYTYTNWELIQVFIAERMPL